MSPALRDLMSAAAGVLRNCRPRYTRDDESYLDELASALTEMEREAAGPVDIDEPVATMADEPIGLREAFAAGAEYMRRSVQMVREDAPYCGTAIPLPRLVMPDAERIDAAAAGYVEGLDR